MILQYFKKKENKYKKIADDIYITIIAKSKDLIKNGFFKEVCFDSSFELICIILVFYLKIFKDNKNIKYKKINDLLIQNFIADLDKTMREIGIGDMSIGKYVKKYVKKLYYRIKIIDPILGNFDDRNLSEYLNSLKFIDKQYTYKMVNNLKDVYAKIEKNLKI